ncbi:hypothetical protein [Halobacteriovorax sp. HLS]|uniref:hypothetical protein n=1 Tax=Halobacteriovorax sp. HLS TaxID=2234000 RepID=UPI000FD8543E|nr:hypothetical protein [Halobacteriovorax sp. HLS]
MQKLFNLIMITLVGALLFANTNAKVEYIPLDTTRIPSNDLLHPELGKLSSEQAWQLQNDSNIGLDLSLLNPIESEVWKNTDQTLANSDIDEIQVSSQTELVFLGVLGSQSGTLRFTVLDNTTGNILNIVLDKNLHTLLLRKNLLRKLGYVVPSMKYKKKVKVAFSSLEEKNHFLERVIPENTFGAPSRWMVADSEVTIDLQDVIVMLPRYGDHYNLAFGVPPKTLTSRTLRSLIVPYSLLDVDEAINTFSFKAARKEANSIELSHFTLADMNTTQDDAKWILGRMKDFSREDFEQIVKNSHLPYEVSLLLVEKLIARRNNLLELFAIDSTPIEFNPKISYGENLKNGRLLKENYDGYASRFAYGDPDSPFRELKYSLLSKLQSDAIDSLIRQANSKLSVFDVNDARLDYHKEQFETGLNHYIETGEFLEQKVGTWVSPIVNGNIILSRDVVVGNYQGSDNLVQTSDIFGYGVSLGANVGIEGLPAGYTALARGQVSYLKTFSHLKPVRSLKASLKEPYKNMIVSLLKKNLEKRLLELSKLGEVEDQENRNERIQLIADEINENLGVGESLIISERLTPSFLVKGGYSWANTKLSLAIDTNSVLMKRVHIYRKDADTVQVYVDNGKLGEVGVSIELDSYIPVTKLNFSVSKGNFNVELYNVNINSDPDLNPKLFSGVNAIYSLLDSGSKELLGSYTSPYKIKNSFLDKSSKYAFLNWRMKKLKKRGQFSVFTPENYEAKFFKYTYQKMIGLNNWAFARDVANYYLSKITEYITLRNETWKRPSQTFYGVNAVEGLRFESRYDETKKGRAQFPDTFMALEILKEGWKIKESKLKKMISEINEEFGTKIFSDSDINDATGLKLYSVSVNLNIYEKGVWNILDFNEDKILELGREYRKKYYDRRHCSTTRLNRAPISKRILCGKFQPFVDKRESCVKKMKKDEYDGVACLVDLTMMYKRLLNYEDFISIIGKSNTYLNGKITGYRQESDILSTPINGNTEGQVSGKYWNGPVEELRTRIEMQSNEFNGSWLRENM